MQDFEDHSAIIYPPGIGLVFQQMRLSHCPRFIDHQNSAMLLST
jgi:hypothetical protein